MYVFVPNDLEGVWFRTEQVRRLEAKTNRGMTNNRLPKLAECKPGFNTLLGIALSTMSAEIWTDTNLARKKKFVSIVQTVQQNLITNKA